MAEITTFQRKILDFAPEISLKLNEPMSQHTSFHIGGPAEVVAFPYSEEELAKLLRFAKENGVKPIILGAGSNVLAPDAGLRGLVICLKNCLDDIEQIDSKTLRFWAGVPMGRAAAFAATQGLSGMEFAHGIPGTIGGGVYMNAGAFGGEMAQIVTKVCTMDASGNRRLRFAKDLGFSYRFSKLQLESDIILWVEVRLISALISEIHDKMKLFAAKRRDTQPIDMPSAGSTFKRPASGFAAAMIDACGLKGCDIGGAMVSEKHAGFIVNKGNATANDVRALMAFVADQVERKFHVRLEPEIKVL